MCRNYRPLSRANKSWVETKFSCELPPETYKDEILPNDSAPFIYIENGKPKCELARFGLVPHWATERDKCGFRTYNARSETVHEKPSYRDAWRQQRFGLVLAESFYEPNWQTGKSVRWKIKRTDQSPLAIASIWERFTDRETGEIIFSFSMLTINATGHEVMKQFHKPDDEKRSVVVLQDHEYLPWLNADRAAAISMMKLAPDSFLTSEPSPLPVIARPSPSMDLFS